MSQASPDPSPASESPERGRGWTPILKRLALLLALGASGALIIKALSSKGPEHEVRWQGPQERPARPAPPPPPVRRFKEPLSAAPMRPVERRAPSASGRSEGAPMGQTRALPPLPSAPWSIRERGALTAPRAALTAHLQRDERWRLGPDGGWLREDAGARVTLTEREGRIIALTVSFNERGSSALMPEIELMLLGSGSPSMIRWERALPAQGRQVGGLLSQPMTGSVAREAYYLCDYGEASAQRTLPERCVFSYEPTQEALSLGAALRPAPQW